jgi:DNA-binding NarL/FixJ family response regulator
MAITDSAGRIVEANEGWSLVLKESMPSITNAGVGLPYGTFWNGGDHRPDELLRSLLAGDIEDFFVISPWADGWAGIIGLRRAADDKPGAILLHINLGDILPNAVFEHDCAAHPSPVDPCDRRQAGSIPLIGLGDRVDLNERQAQILRLLAEGKTNKEIANALHRSPNTIKLQISGLLRLLKVRSRTQAALYGRTLRTPGR